MLGPRLGMEDTACQRQHWIFGLVCQYGDLLKKKKRAGLAALQLPAAGEPCKLSRERHWQLTLLFL